MTPGIYTRRGPAAQRIDVPIDELKRRKQAYLSTVRKLKRTPERLYRVRANAKVINQWDVRSSRCGGETFRCAWLEHGTGYGKCAWYGDENVRETGRVPECFEEVVPRREALNAGSEIESEAP